MRRIACSFSGGESSAKMLHLLLTEFRDRWDDMVIPFANTGLEREETLRFVRDVGEYFNAPVVWLEAVVYPDEARACGHKIVTFETASRNGEPFEAMIQKYGIPNKAYPHCTRELKLNPMKSYLASIGWQKGSYVSAVGIRADEQDRLPKGEAETGIVYPLAHWTMIDKIDVNNFWEAQPFRLPLRTHEGNCSTCWKKSDKKLLRLMHERPELFNFFDRMEQLYGLAGHNEDGRPRTFFRQNRSTADLRALYEAMQGFGWQPDLFDDDQDADDGCTGSCEAFSHAA